MIPLCINAFFSSTLGAIPDDSQCLKVMAIRLYYIIVSPAGLTNLPP